MDERLYSLNVKEGTLKTCKRCKRAFTYYGYGYLYCPTCTEIDSENFQKVKDYIYENGVSQLIEVVEQTGVDEKTITIYLKEGRLEIPEGSTYYLSCEHCGTSIRSGRYCHSCAAALIKEFNTTITYNEIGSKPKNENTGKMRFLDNM
ncbi:MerR family transcriptional regulator [Anaerosporobacter sp.]|uniref:MerR family transcriptional regulator n=1 Tax=Anaerosporobacter sp. TaxID=1872529 RepID=UPI00286EC935|nr:MerR family transcriptional regulator [Anaerosporobacter sp.]